jgi:predicted Rossmann fold flavoprotein
VPDVVIIGAGAAGLMTAIVARRCNPSRSVTLLEGARSPGAKILVSGGSRCNVTNAVVNERDFWGGRPAVVRRILRTFTAADTVRFFADLGVSLHEEADGKLFPDSNRARDVLRALLNELERCGAELSAAHRVTRIARSVAGFTVSTNHGTVESRRVVLATGGQSLPKSGSDGAGYTIAESLGHTIVPSTPALAPLLLDDSSIHRELAGVSHDAELSVWIDGAVAIRLTGSLLWTHFGVSGPVALNASRHWMRAQVNHQRASVTLNFFPGWSFGAVDALLQNMRARSPKATLSGALSETVPASVVRRLTDHLRVDATAPLSQLTREARRQIARALTEFVLPVTGTRGYAFAEATAGGVALPEIDPATMESRKCPGLYLVGEILDVDGRIGGFNFQWAWSTGFVAGRSLARL